MAETYRKAKMASFMNRLIVRKKSLSNQLRNKELINNRELIQGQIMALDLVLEEMKDEFGLEEEEN